MKKILVALSLLSVVFLGACSSPKYVVRDYMKDTYDVDIKIVGTYENSRSFAVAPVNHPNMTIGIRVYDINSPLKGAHKYKNKYFIDENYLSMVELDKEFHKLDKFIPEINKVGFEIKENHSFDDYEKDSYLVVESTSDIKLADFEKKDLNRLYELYKILKKSGASFTVFEISDTGGIDAIPVTYKFNMEQLKDVKTKEEFFYVMKKTNTELFSFFESKKFESEKKKVENERFTLDSEYNDFWFTCVSINENNECAEASISVNLFESIATESKVTIEKDLNSIFAFLKEIAPNTSINYEFQVGKNDFLQFKDVEIEEYPSTLDFIEKLVIEEG